MTDCHLTPLAQKPASRTDEYHNHIDAKWAAFAQQVREFQCHLVAFSGDLLHIKNQSSYTPNDLNRTTDKIESLGVPFVAIPGNHDLPKSSMDNYNRTAYRQIIKAARNAINLSDLNEDGQVMFYSHHVPGTNITISGLPYLPLHSFIDFSQRLRETNLIDPAKINITMLHVDALPRKDALPLPFETLTWAQLTELWPKSDALLLGHIHEGFPFGQNMRLDGQTQLVSKPWSFARNVNNLYVRTETLEYRHRPAFAVIDIDNVTRAISAQYVEIPHEPFERAFNLPTLKAEVKASEEFAGMVEALKLKAQSDAGMQLGASTLDVFRTSIVPTSGVEQSTINKALDYLHRAGVR